MSHGKFSAPPRFVDRIVTINWTLLVAALIAWAGAPLAEATPSDLRTQVHELSVTHGFAVQGLHNLGDDPGRRVDGDLREQLNVLLSAFNYVIVADDSGDIDTVMITSRTRPAGPIRQGINVKTTRRGSHHTVRATLTGPAGNPQSLMLLVDTGATMLVLPQTMIRTLGFSGDDLGNGWSQTANGRVRTKQGILQSVQVGQAIVKDVAVNFVDDDMLGGNSLLGMSFLSRFRITIDDKNERLILIAR
jgi:aspartyl protease family protein